MVTGIAETAARPRLISRSTYALCILTLIYGVSQLDRQVISLLLEGIKKEMHVSDTVLGLVSVGTGLDASRASVPSGSRTQACWPMRYTGPSPRTSQS